MSRILDMENEINNRFLDLIKFYKETCPQVNLNLLLEIYQVESTLNFFAIAYNSITDLEEKERILKKFTDSTFDLYQKNKLLKEQLEK